ncbi:MAG: hypothetical protein ACJKTH_00970 [Patescibacteria group bacterium UBA2163]
MKSSFSKKIVAVALLLATSFSSFVLPINTSHAAALPVVLVGPSAGFIAATAASSATTAGVTATLTTKETVLDAVTFALKEAMIAAMTQSIIDWINSGFEGGPSFVSNLNQFLGEVADHTALDFIEGTDLGFICSPFELEIRLSLALQRQPFRERIRCSLGDVADNIDGFFNDFSQGGWETWFRLHAESQNNPYGAYGQSLGELEARINARQDEELAYLNFGEGFFSKRECIKYSEEPVKEGEEPECLVHEIVTPGTQINQQLGEVLGSGFESLELADEINEIVNALIAQLAQEALTSLSGLRGLSSRSGSSARTYVDNENRLIQGSYVEALTNESDNALTERIRESARIQARDSLSTEERYRNAVNNIITALEEADEEVRTCYYETYRVQNTRRGIENADGLIPYYESNLAVASSNTRDLQLLRSEIEQARTIDEASNISTNFSALIDTGITHTDTDIAVVDEEYDTLLTIISDPATYCDPEEEETVSQ